MLRDTNDPADKRRQLRRPRTPDWFLPAAGDPVGPLVGLFLGVFACAFAAAVVHAEWTTDPDHRWCEDSHNPSYCEVRVLELPKHDSLEIEASRNGGISVRAWDNDEIKIYARVVIHRDTGSHGEELLEKISISEDGMIAPDGPYKREWSVSFRAYVPKTINLDLSAFNGGISIDGVEGEIEFDTHNGGIDLLDVGGRIDGTTKNGGLLVQLAGPTWMGEGLNLETVNGSISLTVPEEYSARLISGTSNGSLDLDHSIDLDGKVGRKRVRGTLGDGGPLVRLVTKNGRVEISER